MTVSVFGKMCRVHIFTPSVRCLLQNYSNRGNILRLSMKKKKLLFLYTYRIYFGHRELNKNTFWNLLGRHTEQINCSFKETVMCFKWR